MSIDLPINTKRGKNIVIFSDDCELCNQHIDNVTIGKCVGCSLKVIKLHDKTAHTVDAITRYQIVMHPTTIIDDEIKIKGVPDFYWQCGDEFYEDLKSKFSFNL